jgi:hypothetical protein
MNLWPCFSVTSVTGRDRRQFLGPASAGLFFMSCLVSAGFFLRGSYPPVAMAIFASSIEIRVSSSRTRDRSADSTRSSFTISDARLKRPECWRAISKSRSKSARVRSSASILYSPLPNFRPVNDLNVTVCRNNWAKLGSSNYSSAEDRITSAFTVNETQSLPHFKCWQPMPRRQRFSCGDGTRVIADTDILKPGNLLILVKEIASISDDHSERLRHRSNE